MVAAYVIGFSITKEDLAACPYLKFASGENDTGVIVSWNTEGPKNAEENAQNVVVLPNGISINPLNWKLDETYAPASENLGSLVHNEKTGELEIADIGADAQVNPARGVVVTNAKALTTTRSTTTTSKITWQNALRLICQIINNRYAVKYISIYQIIVKTH